MTHLTDPEMTAVPPSTSSDPRVVALLDAAQRHVDYLDVVLADNEHVIEPLRASAFAARDAELVSA